MSSVGTRCRVVTDQDGERHVSSVVLSPDESVDFLLTEAEMHQKAGWSVVMFERGLVAVKGEKSRRVWLRFTDPMDDLT